MGPTWLEDAVRALAHGANGTGKSTWLKALAEASEPDTGTVRRRGDISYHLAPRSGRTAGAGVGRLAGALVVVSHDRLLTSRFVGRRCEMRAGRPLTEGRRAARGPRSI
nr:ATP-binding cassette domain-containing protein [Streptomyces olivoreticuli]